MLPSTVEESDSICFDVGLSDDMIPSFGCREEQWATVDPTLPAERTLKQRNGLFAEAQRVAARSEKEKLNAFITYLAD